MLKLFGINKFLNIFLYLFQVSHCNIEKILQIYLHFQFHSSDILCFPERKKKLLWELKTIQEISDFLLLFVEHLTCFNVMLHLFFLFVIVVLLPDSLVFVFVFVFVFFFILLSQCSFWHWQAASRCSLWGKPKK